MPRVTPFAVARVDDLDELDPDIQKVMKLLEKWQREGRSGRISLHFDDQGRIAKVTTEHTFKLDDLEK